MALLVPLFLTEDHHEQVARHGLHTVTAIQLGKENKYALMCQDHKISLGLYKKEETR